MFAHLNRPRPPSQPVKRSAQHSRKVCGDASAVLGLPSQATLSIPNTFRMAFSRPNVGLKIHSQTSEMITLDVTEGR